MKPFSFISLRVKFLAILVGAICFSGLIFWGLQVAGVYWVNEYFMSPAVTNARISKNVDELQQYITENDIASTQLEALNSFQDTHCMILSVALPMSRAASDEALLSVMGDSEAIDESALFPLTFADQELMVSFWDYKYVVLLSHIDTVALVMALLCFGAILFIFYQRNINKILLLARQVQQVQQGTQTQITPLKGRDELSALSKDMDQMCQTLTHRLEQEKLAWQANNELITSMSHDIRTPLTVLIGYLEIIESKKYQTAEQLQNYLHNSKQKALQLKTLSDKLFEYAVVYSTTEPEKIGQTLELEQLIEQILGERMLYLQSAGYQVELTPAQKSCKIKLDVPTISRVFDNCLSNIQKYGTTESPVQVTVSVEEQSVIISLANGINLNQSAVESTRIGLKSCEKLMQQLGGQFTHEVVEQQFIVHLTLPIQSEVET